MKDDEADDGSVERLTFTIGNDVGYITIEDTSFTFQDSSTYVFNYQDFNPSEVNLFEINDPKLAIGITSIDILFDLIVPIYFFTIDITVAIPLLLVFYTYMLPVDLYALYLMTVKLLDPEAVEV
jgi:hypothetical protein